METYAVFSKQGKDHLALLISCVIKAKTDRFESDAWEKAIDHQVHGIRQHGSAELLQ